jgi:hypothetical protein
MDVASSALGTLFVSMDHGVWRHDENHFAVATSGRDGTLVAAFEGKMEIPPD